MDRHGLTLEDVAQSGSQKRLALFMDGNDTSEDFQGVDSTQGVTVVRDSGLSEGDAITMPDGSSSFSDSHVIYSKFLPVLGLYIGLRVALLLCAVVAAVITRAPSWLDPFTAWDGHWYIQVAQAWYGSSRLGTSHLTYSAGGFEPGWPAIIKFGALLGLSYAGSAFLMSIVVGAATVYAIWRLSQEIVPRSSLAATTAVIVFPGAAVVFGIAYSEVLSIGCAAATLLLLIRRRWVFAGTVAMIATATSSLAVVLPVACLVEAYLAIRGRRDWKALWAVVISPLGFVGFVAYLGYLAKDPLYWWKLQGQAWGAKIEPGYVFHWLRSFSETGWGTYWLAASGLLVLIYLITTMIYSEFPVSIKVYCGVVALMVLINPALGPKPRFLFWLFPCLMLLPINLKPRAFNSVVIVMAWLLPLLLIAYTTIGNTVAQP